VFQRFVSAKAELQEIELELSYIRNNLGSVPFTTHSRSDIFVLDYRSEAVFMQKYLLPQGEELPMYLFRDVPPSNLLVNFIQDCEQKLKKDHYRIQHKIDRFGN
jgi:hypothetical protein